MSNFLLIHGGSHGAWCWEGVIRELARLGHTGYAFDLPGGGNDATPRKNVTFDSYVNAVNAFIAKEKLEDFVLVGHSLAGIILPDIIAANISHVRQAVFIAAFTLNAGERAIDLMAPERVAEYYQIAEASPEYSLMLDTETARRRFFSDLNDTEADNAYARLTPQPFMPYLAPAGHSANAFGSIARYILCRNDRNLPIDQCLGFSKKLNGRLEYIDAGHDVMLSKPEALTALLVNGSVVGN